jgi:hypothetical protein
LFYPLEYFFCFFDREGNPKPKGEQGFYGIISNPPWEAIKPVKKEFAKLGKYEMDSTSFELIFNKKLNDDSEFKTKWDKYINNYNNFRIYYRNKYVSQGKGDLNYYKLFMERDFQLIKSNGSFCLLVPSGFQTDEGSGDLRKLLISKYHLLELLSFENKGYKEETKKYKTKLFPEVHPQFKFSIVYAKKEYLNGNKHKFRAKFYIHDPQDLYNENYIFYDIEKIKQFSPENLSIMEFKSDKDYDLCMKIKDEFILFREKYPIFKREYHMTDDNNLFVKSKSNLDTIKLIRLFEGKTIHQFTSNYLPIRYYVDKTQFYEDAKNRSILRLSQELEINREEAQNLFNKFNLPSENSFYRLSYRAIGSSTNERTLIASILPKDVATVNSINQLIAIKYFKKEDTITYKRVPESELVLLMSLLNSLTLNYYIRNKISANLNMFYIYELPIAEASEEQKKRIIELGFSLLYRKSIREDFEDLKNELNVEVDSREDLAEIRAELEIIIAKHLYGLNIEDWEYLTSTFVYGDGSDTKAELDEIIRISKEKWEIY